MSCLKLTQKLSTIKKVMHSDLNQKQIYFSKTEYTHEDISHSCSEVML